MLLFTGLRIYCADRKKVIQTKRLDFETDTVI